MRRLGHVAIALATLLALAVLVLWLARKPLAEGAIGDELARRGVPASYRIASLGLRWQRLENIRLGDPRRPDLTADWAEVRVSGGFGGIRVTAIRAGGVRLRGRLVDGTVTWGTLDRLLPRRTGAPFTLPDLDVAVADARIGLDTPYGPIGARLDGNGNLADGFRGKLAAVMPRLTAGGCTVDRTTAYVDLAIQNRAPAVSGPVRANAAVCGDIRFADPAVQLDATLSEAFDRWRGSGAIALSAGSVADQRVSGVSGRIAFDGTPRGTSGNARLKAVQGQSGATRLAGLTLDARYAVRGAIGDIQGTIGAATLLLDRRYASQVATATRASADTPVGPLLAQLAGATAAASRGLSARADFVAQARPSGSSAVVTQALVNGARGLTLRLAGGEGVRFGAVGLLADTQIDLSGGGFPRIAASFRRTANGNTSGVAQIAPYRAESARLALGPVRFAAVPNGPMRIETLATLDGPLADGRVEGLRTPIVVLFDPRGAVTVNRGCAPLAFRALAISGLRLNPAQLRLCPTGDALIRIAGGRVSGGATVAAPRLSGRIGTTPLTLAASRARYALSGNSFEITGVAARLGRPDRVSRIAIGTLTGRVATTGVAGRFAGLDGQIGNVPLLVDGGTGGWTLTRGILDLAGTATVSDADAKIRFNPLTADDVRLRLADGKIAVTGLLREPKSGVAVSTMAIAHNLARGTGHATLIVSDLTFGKALQPEALTPLTLGVFANVFGSLSGKGEIDWTPAGVTSTGRFATSGFDLAAAFGPVKGLKGELVFTDLLGLVSAPGQIATVDSINPGIPVLDGRIVYRLVPGQRIAVDGGRWPFAGGVLILDPATLDMGETRERRLTFRIEAFDAAKFIEQLKFEDLAATGLFDGTIPMIFDSRGGRIEGGLITARPGGGTLAYVGDVSNAEMNVFAKLAFDALKSIRYQNLTIRLDGPLDGEMVSKVDFNGVNEGPRTAPKGFLARQFTGLPFKFNITIRAPFRGLLSTARTFQDPTLLLRQIPVQPPVSEKRP